MNAIPLRPVQRSRNRAGATPHGSRALRRTIVWAAAFALVLLLGPISHAQAAGPSPLEFTSDDILVRIVRTGPTEAAVLGVALLPDDVIELLVDGVPVSNTTPVANMDYWFLHVPVADGSTVQVRIGLLVSPAVIVPAYVPQAVGPPGFLYAQGNRLLLNGSEIRLFGVNEQTSFPYALIASGLYGWDHPEIYWGNNSLFPSSVNGTIGNVSSPDALWREFFRYLLHYQEVSSEPSVPRPNLLRVWIVDEAFGLEAAYGAWKEDPAAFWAVFDALVYWADRAGVYLVPVLGHQGSEPENAMYDPTSAQYARHLELVRAIVSRYDDHPGIAMWDLWNEADVRNDAYWASVGGIDGYRAWAARYLADVKPYARNHLLTLGTGGWTLFPGVPPFGWQYHVFWSDIPGLEVSQHHGYGTSEDQYLIDWQTAWQGASAIPHFESEYGYNLDSGPSPSGQGYWPWFTERARAANWSALATMLFADNGKGPYADYPFNGTLPEYAPGPPAPSDRAPVAAFTTSPMEACRTEPIEFDASISSDDVGIVVFDWSFAGRGSAKGRTAHHVFGLAGDVPVTLIATDTSGQTDSWTFIVHVSECE